MALESKAQSLGHSENLSTCFTSRGYFTRRDLGTSENLLQFPNSDFHERNLTNAEISIEDEIIVSKEITSVRLEPSTALPFEAIVVD